MFIRGRIGFDLPVWFVPADEKQQPTSAFFAGAIAVFDKTWRGESFSYINRTELEEKGRAALSLAQFAAAKMALPSVSEKAMPTPIATADAESRIWPLEVGLVFNQVEGADSLGVNQQNKLKANINQLWLERVPTSEIISVPAVWLAVCRGPSMREIIVDNFAGGGGASTGIELAIGRSVDIAINHDENAIAMHKTNHPDTLHYCESVFDVDPSAATSGKPVGLAWFSPDCRHFSKAKGAKPVKKEIRGLAWIVLRWALAVRPRVMMLENVEEFKTWGPLLDEELRPDPERAGETFEAFVGMLSTGIAANHPALAEVCEFLAIEPHGKAGATADRRAWL